MEGGGRLSNSTNSIQTILLPSNGSSNLSSNGSKSYMDISNFVKKKYNNTKKAPEVRISLSDFNFAKDAGPENKSSAIEDSNAGSKRDSSEGGFGDDQVHVVAVDEEKLARKEEDIIELWNKFNRVNANILNFMQEKDLIMREIVETKSAINEIKLRTMEHKLFQKLSAKFHKNIPGSSVPSSAPLSQSVTPKQNKTTPLWNFQQKTPSKYKTLARSSAQFKLVRPTPAPQSRNSPKNQTPVQMIRNRTRKYRLVSADSQDGCFEANEVQKAFSAENVWCGDQPEMKVGLANEAKSFSTDNIWCGGATDPKFGVAPESIYGMDTKKYVSAEPIYGADPKQGVAPEPIYGIISNHRNGRVSDVNYGASAEAKQDLTPKPGLAAKEPIYAVSKKVAESAERREDVIKDNSNFAIVGDKIMRQAFNKRSFQVFEEDYSGLEAKPIDQQQFFKRNRRSRRSSIHYNKEEFEYIKAVLDKESAENNIDNEPIYEPIDGPIYENVHRRGTKAFQEGVNLEEEVALNSERPVSANSQVFKCRMDPECEFQDEDQDKLKHHVTNVHLEPRKSFEKSHQESLLKKSDSSEDDYPSIKFDGGSLTSLTGNVGSVVDDDDDVFEEDPISLREIQQDQKSPPDRLVASVIPSDLQASTIISPDLQAASISPPDRLAGQETGMADSISPPDRLADSVDSCDSGVDNTEPVSCRAPNPEVFQCRMDPECTYSGRNIEKHIATKHQKHLAELMKMAQKKK